MFQFTHPGKGATDKHLGDTEVTSEFQFTHPGKGATVTPTIIISLRKSFNSRTLGRVRLDGESLVVLACRFQFTHPGKGATKSPYCVRTLPQVSIHAPWEGCDQRMRWRLYAYN